MPGLNKTIIDGRKGYSVGRRHFRTKNDVGDECRRILYGHLIGQPIEGPDREFLADLLAHHRHAAAKIGCGLAAFEVRENPEYPGRTGFYLTRVDGSATDFSFLECITASPQAGNVRAALRRVIVDQILIARNTTFSNPADRMTCPVTGAEFGIEDCHVDHEPPATFHALVTKFLAARGVDIEAVALTYGDQDIGDQVVDVDLIAAWRTFHGERAKLRVISSRANLSDVVRASNIAKRVSK